MYHKIDFGFLAYGSSDINKKLINDLHPWAASIILNYKMATSQNLKDVIFLNISGRVIHYFLFLKCKRFQHCMKYWL